MGSVYKEEPAGDVVSYLEVFSDLDLDLDSEASIFLFLYLFLFPFHLPIILLYHIGQPWHNLHYCRILAAVCCVHEKWPLEPLYNMVLAHRSRDYFGSLPALPCQRSGYFFSLENPPTPPTPAAYTHSLSVLRIVDLPYAQTHSLKIGRAPFPLHQHPSWN